MQIRERIIKKVIFLVLILSIYPNLCLTRAIKSNPQLINQTDTQTQINTQLPEDQHKEDIFTIEYKSRKPRKKIVHIIYDTATMTVDQAKTLGVKGIEKRKGTENIRVQYPKVVFVGDIKEEDDIRKFYSRSNYYIVYYVAGSIKFFDEEGKLKKEFVFSKHLIGKPLVPIISISKNKKYICVTSCIREHPEVILEAESVILNTDGSILKRIKHNYKYVDVFPNGKYVIGTDVMYSDDPICVYNEEGLVLEIKKDERWYDLDFSEDGSIWAVTFEREIKGPEKCRADLIVFNDECRELWRKEGIVERVDTVCKVKILKDNTIVVMAGNYKIYYFDIKGNLVKKEQGDLQMLRQFKE